MAIHRDLPDAELHEPKGIVSANAGQVYVADGSNSGVWQMQDASNVMIADSAGNFTADNVEDALAELYGRGFYFYDRILDVSTASAVLVPITQSMEVVSIRFTLGGAITTADSLLTISRGGDSAVLGTQSIPFSGSAEGTTFDFTPTGNEQIDATSHKYLKIATDGGSSDAQSLYFTIDAVRI